MNRANAKQSIFDGINVAIVILIFLSWPKDSAEYSQMDLQLRFFQFLGFFVFGTLLSLAISKTSWRTVGDLLFAPSERRQRAPDRTFLTSLWAWQLMISAFVVFLAAAVQTQVSVIELLDINGIRAAGGLFRGLLSPDLSLLPVAIGKIIETVYIAFLATAMAVPIAFVLAFFAAKNIMTSTSGFVIYGVLRVLLNITRSIEPVIWAIIFAVWVGVGPFAGMLALLVQSIASLTKQYSEHIESVEPGPVESIRSTGANQIQTVWYAVVPQVLLPYVSYTIYRWDINVRMATIIGFAGGGGIGTILYQYSMRAQWPEVGCLIAVIAAVVWIMDLMSAYLREALK